MPSRSNGLGCDEDIENDWPLLTRVCPGSGTDDVAATDAGRARRENGKVKRSDVFGVSDEIYSPLARIYIQCHYF